MHRGASRLLTPSSIVDRSVTANPITVRFAALDDLDFVRARSDLAPEILRRKVDWQEIVIAERTDCRVGYAQLEYLWSKIPYLALIWVIEGQRQSGVGRALLAFLESFLQAQGHRFLYSSSQIDEPAPQAWHRRMGFEECGIIAGINSGGVGEVFFRKRLG